MAEIIDIDGMERAVEPLDIDHVFRGAPVREMYREWDNTRSMLGNPPLARPAIINDPGHPVHFGITMQWQVILNLAAVPDGLHGADLVAWLKVFPMAHEIAHYTFCPYDAVTHAKLVVTVARAWNDVSEDNALFVVNYFSDIIINNILHGMNGDAFFQGMKTWVEFTMHETCKNGHQISLLYMTFVLVHELLWNRSFMTFKYPEVANAIASKLASIITFSTDWYDAIYKMTPILKAMIDPGNGKVPSYDPSAVMIAAPAGTSGNGPDGSSKKGDGTATVKVKKGKKVTEKPFDMTFFMGDPVAEKTRGSMDKNEAANELENLMNVITKEGIGFAAASGLMRAMHVAQSDDQAWRLWLRATAKGMISYETMTKRKRRGGSSIPADWEWGKPYKDYNPFHSVMAFPLHPFPPFARGFKQSRGKRGIESLPDVRDLLVVRDSSGSMDMNMGGNDGWRRAFGGQKANNKFNVSTVAAFAVLQSAHAKGARYAVINFSSDWIATDWMPAEDRSLEKAERVILQFQRGGTVVPIRKMLSMLSGKKNCFVLVITDSMLHNWKEFIESFKDLHVNGHEISMIFTKSSNERTGESIMKRLSADNVYMHQACSIHDLYSIIIKEARRVYT